MKGYKGFEKGLICKNKQYKENTVFEEENAEICKSGMHFCKTPFEVWRYYPPCNSKGEFNEFAEVEALEEAESDGEEKFCTTKLKIGAKISFDEFIERGVDHIINDTKNRKESNIYYYSSATNTGDYSSATNTGNCSAATNTGHYSAAINTGDCSAATNAGSYSVATNTGDYSAATNTGHCSSATNTGDYSAATNTGHCSAATNTGDYSSATNTGDYSAATVEGKNSVAVVTGLNGRAKGTKGCWIVCTERDDDYNILCIKAAEVDGEKIKENTFYMLKNGEFVESEEEYNEKKGGDGMSACTLDTILPKIKEEEEKHNVKIEILQNIDDKHQNHLWYGGDVGTITTEDGYKLVISASGDVIMDGIIDGDDFYVKDKNNAGWLYNEIGSKIDDDKLKDLISSNYEDDKNNYINITNNNWFEINLITPDGRFIDLAYMDNVLDDDYLLNCFADISTYLDMLADYKQNH